MLVHAARKGMYIYASGFHARSLILADLVSFYDSEKHVRAAVSTAESRIKMACDLYEMRLRRKINIRMSIARETDRYTLLLNDEVDRSIRTSWTLTPVSRLNQLRVLFL